jgi:glycosyltransferase involved in cell wall biosynthesis
MTKIVLIAPRLPYGGAERQMAELKNEFSEAVSLIDLSRNISIDEHGSQQAFDIIGPGIKNKIHRAVCMYKLYREYSNTQDKVFIFYNSVFIWLAYFLKIKGHKVYFSLREYNLDFFNPTFLHALKKLDGLFTNTPRLFNVMKERGMNIQLVLNTIPLTDEDRPLTLRDKNKILIVSNVEPHKQILEVINALSSANYNIQIAGSHANKDYFRKCQEAAKISKCNISFLGSIPRDALVELYKTSGCFIHASLVEGTSNAIIDAITYNIPTIVGNTPENRYLVDDLPQFIWENGSLERLLETTLSSSEEPDYQQKQLFLQERIKLKFGKANLHQIYAAVMERDGAK